MKDYKEFVNKLKIDYKSFLTLPKKVWVEAATKNVDGLAAAELRRLVDLDIRRKYGAFFTDSLLAEKVLTELAPIFTKESIIYDPACGAGNLLIAAANYALNSGIKLNYYKQLLGTDLHQEFVNAAQLRIATNSLLKHNLNSLIKHKIGDIKKYKIKKSDGLVRNAFYSDATHIIVNPPFNQCLVSEKLSWADGKVSAAALFIDKIIQHIKPGVTIIAILPDVLRSGTRYEKWRALIEEKCILGEPVLFGKFDKYTDVDVYAICLRKKDNKAVKQIKQITPKINEIQSLKHKFDICVGPVVDNRDPHIGPSRPYLISKGLEGWTIYEKVSFKRNHKGKNFKSPFVVIKRTSRMEDRNRAVATIINIKTPIYVDNHLIILKPKSGKISDCKKVLRILKDERTNAFLNKEIRCRHLTVKVVSKIPL